MSFLGLQGGAAVCAVAAVTLLVSALGRWGALRWHWTLPAVCAGTSLVGWALLAPGGWREVVWPRSVLDHVLFPTAILVFAGLLGQRVRTRWLQVSCAVFAAWWLAGAGAARPEYWRVIFGALMVAGLLHWARASEARGGLAVALAMLGGMVIGGMGWLWIGATSVLVMAMLGMVGAGGSVTSPVLLMVGLVAGELGVGRIVRGGVGVTDFALVGALGAPFAVGWGERVAGRRLKRAAGVIGPVVAALGVNAVAWLAYRVLRSY